MQVNRDLFAEFSTVLGATSWDIALLQEAPPRWAASLAAACRAEAHVALTSRNSLAPLRSALARLNPDLIASAEGGSNLTLVRGSMAAAGRPAIAERRELVIRSRWPERRVMGFTRLLGGTCVANLHATNDRPAFARAEVLAAAKQATEWAGGLPLLFGGDLNLRPADQPDLFAELSKRFGLTRPTAPNAIDHLLVRGLEIVTPPTAWPAERRELSEDGLSLRLSDHAPIEALLALG
jgi:endonuclease/exonuclease/phosphatase family metal-dependent hydrolase